MRQRRRHEQDNLQGELCQIQPPTFGGENKTGQDAEAWLLGIIKSFKLQNYLGNMEARIAIYNLSKQRWPSLVRGQSGRPTFGGSLGDRTSYSLSRNQNILGFS